MGEFTKSVQSGKVPGPLRRNFTHERWKAEFSAADAPDDADQRIYDAALVIHAKLESIRSRLKLSSSSKLSATTRLRAFVATVNHNFLVTRTKTLNAFEEVLSKLEDQDRDEFRAEEFAAKIRLQLPGGFKWSPNEIVESLVDGIEVPVRFALQSNPSLGGNSHLSQVDWTDIVLELNLGIMFRHAEDLWDDCLWNNYKVIQNGRIKAFIPEDVDVKRSYAMGLARRQSLSMGYTVMATKFHRESMKRGSLPRIREVIGIKKEGKRQVIKLSKSGELTHAQEELFIMRGFANEPYYSELLQETLPPLGGLTLSVILDAWIVISRAASVLVESVAEMDRHAVEPDAPTHTWLPNYVPVLQVDALVQALSAAVGIKPDDGRRLIDFFTFRGRAGQEIWASPLIPVGNGTVAPIFAAVASPNLRRLVDVWMRQVGIDLSKRGPAFETHIRASVQQSIASSKVLAGNAICIPHDYTFRPTGGRDEQIDLIVAIGSTVLLAEVKCILEPSESKDVAMHRDTVLGAADQVLRKAQALKDHRTEFARDAKRFGMDLPQQFNVLPLVVVSTSTHVGVPVKGVPVIDEFILEKFLEGELEDVAVRSDDFAIQKRVRTIFYTDMEDAQTKAPQYFASPPQVQRLLDGITGRVIPLHSIDDQDWEGFVVTIECDPSQGDRDGVVAR